ncbi:hypothetical protein J1N35_028659 [Gossypium stocksii]|uniref:RNase H type-1 domain-containing protein n=1 Tax=Gossypium stocksii TaxID=47602 RepID=A0A9D3UWQ4_9ROSI|nr:hypothetical protein J1N35_028659 [Gossypium stocksii]
MCVCGLLVGVASKERVGVLIGNGLQCLVKFIVCGVEYFEDEVGCGGVLRDSDGLIRALFSGPVAAKESFAAEVSAIIITLDVFFSDWGGKLSSGFCNGVRVSGVGVKITLVVC